MTYKEKLLDPLWQRKRLEILTRDNYTCQKCNAVENTLHIHHRHYINGRDPWDYPDSLLVTLCQNCHKLEEEAALKSTEILNTVHHWGIFNTEVIDLINQLIETKIKSIKDTYAK